VPSLTLIGQQQVNRAGQQAGGGGQQGSHHHPTRVAVIQVVQLLCGIRDLGKDQFAMADQRFTKDRGDDAPVGAVEQFDLEIQLKVLNHLGGCGLRDAQRPCRVLDIAMRTHRNQQAQLAQFQTCQGAVHNAAVAVDHRVMLRFSWSSLLSTLIAASAEDLGLSGRALPLIWK